LLNFPNQPNATVRVASNVTTGQTVTFNISGDGAHDSGQQRSSLDSVPGQERATRGAPRADSSNRPGGGLGPPIDAPDPLNRYRWFVLGGAGAVLLIGGIYVARPRLATRDVRRQTGPPLGPATQPKGNYERPDAAVLEKTRVFVPAESISILMNGIREELFQIEVEHKQGHLSQVEYEKARSALDQTLARALKRQDKKPKLHNPKYS
jgi:hypothetical protein